MLLLAPIDEGPDLEPEIPLLSSIVRMLGREDCLKLHRELKDEENWTERTNRINRRRKRA